MKREILLFEVGGEGGSIQLYQINDYFLYTTDERTLKEFVPDLTMDELRSRSDVFTSFNEAMKSLLKTYPVFELYPFGVHPDYKDKIIPWYQKFCLKYAEYPRRKSEWEELLFDPKKK